LEAFSVFSSWFSFFPALNALMLGCLNPRIAKRKPSITFGDFYDVTLGSPAIFKSNVSSGGKRENQGQNEVLRPVAFRPHLTVGLAFCRIQMI